MWVPLYDGLLLEFQLTRIIFVPLDTHRAIMVTIKLSQNKVVYGCCNLIKKSSIQHEMNLTKNRKLSINIYAVYLIPLKNLSIVKFQS
ncbi:hypothetical protein HanXRQr2_Chr09g0392761 [Helianthus annuus]|uniref:Uncharacterized protein n=1 Tax=Helianthus annuus TaxID=4232 RepID=A0A9K3I6A2_HELAN|nr:hypothetical protein HanXRQr2_Chr09g0392761 [Helianthus annuus]KAJ0893536.1 hypothetical protein HanPSC8_Chr09g0378711 [Helianthus annuus]